MSRYLTKTTEVYNIDTEAEVMAFQEEVREAHEYEVAKFQWTHKITKNDDYYLVAVEKKYYEGMEEE